MIGFLLQGVCRAKSSYIINLTTGGAEERLLFFFLCFLSDERIAFCFYPFFVSFAMQAGIHTLYPTGRLAISCGLAGSY